MVGKSFQTLDYPPKLYRSEKPLNRIFLNDVEIASSYHGGSLPCGHHSSERHPRVEISRFSYRLKPEREKLPLRSQNRTQTGDGEGEDFFTLAHFFQGQ